eukprot:1035520-Rhodomonas_salina.1
MSGTAIAYAARSELRDARYWHSEVCQLTPMVLRTAYTMCSSAIAYASALRNQLRFWYKVYGESSVGTQCSAKVVYE